MIKRNLLFYRVSFLSLLHLLFYIEGFITLAQSELTKGYTGNHWQKNAVKQEIINVNFSKKNREIVRIKGFTERFLFAFDSNKKCGWATNHKTFGSLVKLIPDQKKIVSITGFKEPIDLKLDPSDGSLWVLDGHLDVLAQLNSEGQVLNRVVDLPNANAIDLSPSDKSIWIVSGNQLAKISQNGKELFRTSVQSRIASINANQYNGECWIATADNQVIKFQANGMEISRIQFEDIKAILVPNVSGNCWVVNGDQVIMLTSNGNKSNIVLGYSDITAISGNPLDETLWVTDQDGDRLSKVPQDQNEAVLAVTGLNNSSDNNLKMARQTAIRLVQWKENVITKSNIDESIEQPNRTDLLPPDESTDLTQLLPNQLRQTLTVNPKPRNKISQSLPQFEFSASEPTGIVFIELSLGLSLKRIKNTASVIGRRYVWNFENETYTLLLGLDVETYNAYVNKDWGELSTNNLETLLNLRVSSEIAMTKPIAIEFHEFGTAKNWNSEKLVSFILAFIQCLPYTADEDNIGDEQFAYAYETLVSGGGDCEDTTILATSILMGLGYEVIFLCIDPPDSSVPGHLAFGVTGNYAGNHFDYQGRRYFYCESTGTGWRVGQLPDMYQNKKFQLIPITQNNSKAAMGKNAE
ncbi:TPA: hypothetical protein EYG59_03305 [Candidatus Poribacteria bacterium]|nr:hypothetical protein [Candidatus Poribacteria bacterium]